MPTRDSTTRGFARAAGLMQGRIRTATQSRGFAVSRLLTHWEEVAGAEIAAVCRPVEVSYGRQNMGATLCLLTTGAQAPMLEMQKERIVERVNACYGYRAITRIRITQTAGTGFSEGRAQFGRARASHPEPPRTPLPEAAEAARDVTDPGLRDALERLGTAVMTRRPPR